MADHAGGILATASHDSPHDRLRGSSRLVYETIDRVASRFWRRVRRAEGTACWIWNGTKTLGGYGLIRFFGRRSYAHRVVLVLVGRELPPDSVVRHACDTPACVNPAHLSVGTHADNVRDKVQKGRSYRPTRSEPTCSRGHPFTPENTYRYRRGGYEMRRCRECARWRQRRWRARATTGGGSATRNATGTTAEPAPVPVSAAGGPRARSVT